MTLPASNAENNQPRFADSPAIRWFGHLIPEDGIINAVDARILWNVSSLSGIPGPIRIHDVAVFYWPKDLIKENSYLYAWMYGLDDGLRCSSGNVYSAWDEDHIEILTDLIKDFYYFSFLNEAAALRAREEFARIRECGWARDPNVPMPPVKPWTAEEHQAAAEATAKAEAAYLDDDWNPDDHSVAAWAEKDVSNTPHVNFTGMTDG